MRTQVWRINVFQTCARVLLVAFLLQCLPFAALAKSPVHGQDRSAAGAGPDPTVLEALKLAGVDPQAYQPDPVPGGPDVPSELRLPPPEGQARDLDQPPEPGLQEPEPVLVAQGSPPEEPAEDEEPPVDPETRRARNQMARLVLPDRDSLAVPYRLSRVNSAQGYYFDITSDRTAYANDHLIYFSRSYADLENPGSETIEWDFVSPVAEHNLTARGSSASVRFVYESVGAEATALDSSYTIKTTVWDRGRPEGKQRNRVESEETHLESLYFYVGVTARDPGEWTVRETRGGELVDEYTFTVLAMPEPQTEWSRRVGGQSYGMPELVAYTTDEWVARKKTYTLSELCSETAVDPEPDPESDPEMDGDPDMAKNCTILWHWRSLDNPELNTTKWGTYLTVKLRYRQNRQATRHKLAVRVFDDVYRGGRLVHFEKNEEPPPAEYTLAYGQGLPSAGNWSFTELHDDQQVAAQSLEMRALEFGVIADSATASPENGATGYTVRLEARPDTWKVVDATVSLDIVNADTNDILDSLSEVVAGNADNPLDVHFTWAPPEALLGRRIMPLPRFQIDTVALRSAPVLAQGGPVADFGAEELFLGEPQWVAQASVAPIWPPAFIPPAQRPPAHQDAFDVPFTVRQPIPILAISSSQAFVRVPGNPGREVDVVNAESRHRVTDMVLATRGLPIVISRTHLLSEQHVAPKFGWRWSFHRELSISSGDGSVTYVDELGNSTRFALDGSSYVPPRPDVTAKLQKIGAFSYELAFKNKTRYIFDVVPGQSSRAVLSREEDRNGNANVYTWNALGTQLLSIDDPAGRQVSFTWQTGQLPTSFEDWTGRTVTYEYRQVGFHGVDLLLSRVKTPGNNVIRYGYTTGQMSTGGGYFNSEPYRMLNLRVGATGVQEKLQTDSDGLFRQATNGKGVTTTLERELFDFEVIYVDRGARVADAFSSDAWSLLAQHEFPGQAGGKNRLIRRGPSVDKVWTFEFNENFRVIEMSDPLNGLSRLGYDPAGNLAGLVNANNQSYNYLWDERNNIVEMSDPLNHSTTFVWSQEDNLERINQPEGVVQRFTYDAKGNMATAVDPMGRTTHFSYNANGQLASRTNSGGKTWTYSYNPNGYLTRVTLPGSAQWNFTVDELGRRTAVTDPRGKTWTYEYDDRDRLTRIDFPDNGAIVYQWDRNDQLTSVRDPMGNRTEYEYNDQLELVSVTAPGNNVTSYTYNDFGNLLTLTAPGNRTTSYQYDKLNRLLRTQYPGGDVETFVYDAIGNLKTLSRGGSTVSYGHDSANRLTSISHPSVGTVSFNYDALSRRTSMSDPTGTTTWDYNDNSQVTSVLVPRLGRINYAYDTVNRVTSVTDPGGQVTNYTWTDRNELASASLDGQAVTYGYDAAGNLTSTTFPNGMSCNRTYDDRSRVEQIEYVKGMAEPLLSLSYNYDRASNVKREIAIGPTGERRVQTYDYDVRYQLTGVQEKVGPGSPAPKEHFAYDQNMNRTAANGLSFSYNSADQLTSGASYNASGATTSLTLPGHPQRTYTYNYADLPTQISQSGTGVLASYLYNGDNQRVERTAGGETIRYLWNGSEILNEYTASGSANTLKTQSLLGLGREGIKTDGAWYFMVTDRLGTVRYLVDSTGSVVESYDYSSFGVETDPDSHTVYNPWRYTGQYYDQAEGHLYLRARYYQPELGRFLVRDPIGYDGGLNLYAYVSNNPVNFVDPSGLQTGVGDPDWNPLTGQPGPNPYIEIGRRLKREYEEARLEAMRRDPSGRAVDNSLAGRCKSPNSSLPRAPRDQFFAVSGAPPTLFEALRSLRQGPGCREKGYVGESDAAGSEDGSGRFVLASFRWEPGDSVS